MTPGELEELQREGIPLEEMLAPTGYEGDGSGHVRGVRFVRTALGEPDASGRRRPVPIPGSQCIRPADHVILATGQFPDTSWIDDPLRSELVGDDGWLKTGRAVRTAREKLFAAGDFARGAIEPDRRHRTRQALRPRNRMPFSAATGAGASWPWSSRPRTRAAGRALIA